MAADGQPTTDPAEAIKGMLAPAAGPKGFGLAFVIDLLCGGLVRRRDRRRSAPALRRSGRALSLQPALHRDRYRRFPGRRARFAAARATSRRSASAHRSARRASTASMRRANSRMRRALANARHLHAEPADARQPDRSRPPRRHRHRTRHLQREVDHEDSRSPPRSSASRTGISRTRPRSRRRARSCSSPA